MPEEVHLFIYYPWFHVTAFCHLDHGPNQWLFSSFEISAEIVSISLRSTGMLTPICMLMLNVCLQEKYVHLESCSTNQTSGLGALCNRIIISLYTKWELSIVFSACAVLQLRTFTALYNCYRHIYSYSMKLKANTHHTILVNQRTWTLTCACSKNSCCSLI